MDAIERAQFMALSKRVADAPSASDELLISLEELRKFLALPEAEQLLKPERMSMSSPRERR